MDSLNANFKCKTLIFMYSNRIYLEKKMLCNFRGQVGKFLRYAYTRGEGIKNGQ